VIAYGGGDFLGARIIDRTQNVENCLRQVGRGASRSSKQDDALLVSYPRDGVDEFRGWRYPEKAREKRTNFASPQPPQSASGSHSNIGIEVFQKIEQQRCRFRPRPHQTARIRAYLRAVIPQQIADDIDREPCLEARRCG
jgi:hypothetical protein